jgi:phenylalanyl-tRNA synthetase alpha chain
MNTKLYKKNIQNEIDAAKTLRELDQVFRKYLGKKGEITQILRSVKNLPKEKKVKVGKEINELKNFLEIKFNEKIQELKEKIEREIEEKEWIDVTLPGKKIEVGHLHPLTQIKRKIEEIFQAIGFSIVEGPEIETEWYNFDALNVPLEHPAREMQATLWIKQKNRENLPTTKKLLMRTHTSPVQIRYMQKNNPPFRIIVIGRVFRAEATDAYHEVQFYQIEGLMVDKKVSLANLKWVLETFMKSFFGKDIKFRWQPSYFPFVEPGLELLINCNICKGKGCSTCGNRGWVEIIGCGMVHPNVFKAAGLNPKNWQGFAFGMGLDRLAMMKYKINDIRLFYSGDLRFLKQF